MSGGRSPRNLIVCGLALMVAGWLTLLAMVVGLVPAGAALSVLAYAVSIAGLFSGVYGVIQLRQRD